MDEEALNDSGKKLLDTLVALGVEIDERSVAKPDTLRYAVHEAVHALDAKLTKKWTNEAIDRGCKKIGRARAARSELVARAVEQMVCAHLGVKILPLEKWALTSCMEAIKFRDPFMGYEDALKGMQLAMKSDEALRTGNAILALAGLPPMPDKRTRRKR